MGRDDRKDTPEGLGYLVASRTVSITDEGTITNDECHPDFHDVVEKVNEIVDVINDILVELRELRESVTEGTEGENN